MDTLIKALQAGQVIENPASWKNVQKTTSALVVLLSAGVAVLKAFGVDLHVTDEQLVGIATVIGAVLGAVNAIITVVTTDKIGVMK
jgi:hypothetical protein